MKFLFVDETGTTRDPKFYGICAVSIDSNHYSSIAKGFSEHIHQSGWKKEYEFKGKYLFSNSRGDPDVTIDKRLILAQQILGLNISGRNAKLRAVFAWGLDGDKSHLSLVQACLTKLLPLNPQQRFGKHLCLVFVDENSRIDLPTLKDTIDDTLADRGYKLVEDVISLKSKPTMWGFVMLI